MRGEEERREGEGERTGEKEMKENERDERDER